MANFSLKLAKHTFTYTHSRMYMFTSITEFEMGPHTLQQFHHTHTNIFFCFWHCMCVTNVRKKNQLRRCRHWCFHTHTHRHAKAPKCVAPASSLALALSRTHSAAVGAKHVFSTHSHTHSWLCCRQMIIGDNIAKNRERTEERKGRLH